MFYDVKLARVELEKDNPSRNKDGGLFNEHLEVIIKLDDDNPFDTGFDKPKDK